MTLDYIYHSGFAIETPQVTVILDYYHDSNTPLESPEATECGYVHRRLLQREGAIYVLASHFHPDHFNPEVLQWKTLRPDIHYIFSNDILKYRRASADQAIWLHKGDIYQDEQLTIRACGSTDVGISFLLDIQGMRFFHAGDLNNWHWSEESTPQEIKKAEGDYLAELKYLRQWTDAVDVALFPVDSRIGKDYMRGAKQFVEQIKTTTFVPMHFGEDYAGGNAFRTIAEQAGCQFCAIRHRGMSFELAKQPAR